uniref:Putative serine protease K12H4.7 n=1 Tax=Lygus hesperus TaxID=30085 RepID=A0A0A9XTD3_LYGHE
MYTVLLCLIVINLFGGLANAGSVDRKHNLRSIGKPGYVHESALPADEWFMQRLDHFDPTNQGTWYQRYQTNPTFFKTSRKSPVFLMIGGEGAISAEWMVLGAWMDYAKQYNALCFQLEHRFYGESKPTEDSSVSNLRYLSSEQALADLAYFIEGMNEKYNLTSNNKWIVFGGSYAGSLAAWARLKYPHLIHAAVSTSGPLLAEANFKQYDEVVRESLAASSKQCAANVHQAALTVEQLLKKGDSEDVEKLSKMFKLCETLDIRNPKDVSNFVSSIAGNIQGIVQYNKDNRITAGALPPTVDDICNIMDNTTIGTPLERYAAVNTLLLSEPCLDVSYYSTIQQLKGSAYSDSRSWIYQTCTEFGFYQTSSSKGELFGSLSKLPFFIDQCKDIYGEDFDSNRLNQGTKRSNLMYGQVNIKVSRVVFVQGSLDPWHVLGVYKSTNPEAPAILINGTAHCANSYPPSPDDPPQLTNARKQIVELLEQWLATEG